MIDNEVSIIQKRHQLFRQCPLLLLYSLFLISSALPDFYFSSFSLCNCSSAIFSFSGTGSPMRDAFSKMEIPSLDK